MNLARTDFESGAISRPEFLAQVASKDYNVDYKLISMTIPVMRIISGEEKHEDGGGGEQLQILHKGDKIGHHKYL